ncbi:LysR family transcriptional regulator [Labrys wisconsinensis]|uniref:DNA-binding transcriptional LysR family regulator n=1 Tax=Labrys wisconsinensis TaxID=425677 RepID=A0ABU0JKP5_9HYPH|nr:LysR family transcriptional regulator [Labrys wisconsinensis]MDQ0474861.1 DNA-binding transcriptional LysR family regulator [Labrys wisconsinensis]
MVHSSPTLPPLDTLEAFAHAARSGSFSAAAETLGLTHGAVSRQVARLERWMGVKLFQRAARGVTLTPDGSRFFVRAEEALALLGSGEDRWVQRRGPAVVRLSATPSLASLWLFPRMRLLEGDDLHLDLVIEHRLADFSEGVDLAIRCGRGPWAGIRSLRLWREEIAPIAAPTLADRIGPVPSAARLLDWPILHDSNTEGWRHWLAAAGIDYAPRSRDCRFEDYHLVLEACALGLGVALTRPMLAQPAIDAGRVVVLDERTVTNPVAFHLIRPDEPLRAPAAEMAGRLLRAAGIEDEAIAAFVNPGRPRAQRGGWADAEL